jgi:hypothetical protein
VGPNDQAFPRVDGYIVDVEVADLDYRLRFEKRLSARCVDGVYALNAKHYAGPIISGCCGEEVSFDSNAVADKLVQPITKCSRSRITPVNRGFDFADIALQAIVRVGRILTIFRISHRAGRPRPMKSILLDDKVYYRLAPNPLGRVKRKPYMCSSPHLPSGRQS